MDSTVHTTAPTSFFLLSFFLPAWATQWTCELTFDMMRLVRDNATPPLRLLMPPGARRDATEICTELLHCPALVANGKREVRQVGAIAKLFSTSLGSTRSVAPFFFFFFLLLTLRTHVVLYRPFRRSTSSRWRVAMLGGWLQQRPPAEKEPKNVVKRVSSCLGHSSCR